MKKDPLTKIQEWYLRKCDGTWEHVYGVTVETIDNPGWSVSITGAHSKLMKQLVVERSESDWIHVDASAESFSGYAGPANLEELMQIAAEWLESN